uniref:Uncharacterized protein n=1 Tax=Timema monikensis TaxID=170555 RepID=A0A7R9EG10_9NEOP|nr:unnamed protein product [Timema monikensis]
MAVTVLEGREGEELRMSGLDNGSRILKYPRHGVLASEVVDLTTQAPWMSLLFVTDAAEFPSSMLGAVEWIKRRKDEGKVKGKHMRVNSLRGEVKVRFVDTPLGNSGSRGLEVESILDFWACVRHLGHLCVSEDLILTRVPDPNKSSSSICTTSLYTKIIQAQRGGRGVNKQRNNAEGEGMIDGGRKPWELVEYSRDRMFAPRHLLAQVFHYFSQHALRKCKVRSCMTFTRLVDHSNPLWHVVIVIFFLCWEYIGETKLQNGATSHRKYVDSTRYSDHGDIE